LSDRSDRNQVFTGGSGSNIAVRDVMKDDFGFEIPVESIPSIVVGVEQAVLKHGYLKCVVTEMTAPGNEITLIQHGTIFG